MSTVSEGQDRSRRGQREERTEKQRDFRRGNGTKVREKGQRGGGKCCLNEGTEAPQGPGGWTYEKWRCWNKWSRPLLVTHREAAFGGPGGAQILSPEWDKCPTLGTTEYVTDQGSGPPQAIEIDQRPDKKFRQGFTGAPAAAARSENKQQVPLLALPRAEGRACSLCGVRVGVCPGVGWRGGLGVLPTR